MKPSIGCIEEVKELLPSTIIFQRRSSTDNVIVIIDHFILI